MNPVEKELRRYAEIITPKHVAEVMLAGADEIRKLEEKDRSWAERCDRLIEDEVESQLKGRCGNENATV